MKARKETIFFLAALFVVLLAGDIIWWQAVQLSADYDSIQWTTLSANINDPDADIKQAEQEFIEVDSAINRDTKILEEELKKVQ